MELPDPGIEPGSLALQADSLPAEIPGKLLVDPATIFSHFFLRYLIASCQALGFPDSSVGKESTAMQETPVQFLGWEDSLEKE